MCHMKKCSYDPDLDIDDLNNISTHTKNPTWLVSGYNNQFCFKSQKRRL